MPIWLHKILNADDAKKFHIVFNTLSYYFEQ